MTTPQGKFVWYDVMTTSGPVAWTRSRTVPDGKSRYPCSMALAINSFRIMASVVACSLGTGICATAVP